MYVDTWVRMTLRDYRFGGGKYGSFRKNKPKSNVGIVVVVYDLVAFRGSLFASRNGCESSIGKPRRSNYFGIAFFKCLSKNS
jgi:hypothetical protein